MSGPLTTVKPLQWACASNQLTFERPLVMGILNVTPDSFSDGGLDANPEEAIARGLRLEAAGADILDVGGESTRPGAEAVSARQELHRVLPVLAGLLEQGCRIPLSIDTQKAAVARAAIEAGACIINDVSAATTDRDMAEVAARTGAGLVLMHMRGIPATMQDQPEYTNVVDTVCGYLQQRMDAVMAKGVQLDCIVVDPGIGFGKTLEHNLDLLNAIPKLAKLGRPVLIGASRKSLLEPLTGRSVDDRLAGSLALAAWSQQQGAHILRVHDVKETCDLVHVLATLGGHGS